MRITHILFALGFVSCFGASIRAAPLIVDHTCVSLYTNLTDVDVARVKTMWADILGASHGLGYRIGCGLLMSNVDSRFQVSIMESGVPEGPTTNHLRISTARRDFQYDSWQYGADESRWYSTNAAIDALKGQIDYCATNNLEIGILGFAWSWTVSWHNLPDGGTNLTYNCRWAGSSMGGPDGDLRWGLTADDFALTGNHVCMDTYINATEQYRALCKTRGYRTVVVFTTAPTDYTGGEAGYQAQVKNDYIRAYVSNTLDGVLFDFADILAWDDAGNRTSYNWTDFGGQSRSYDWVAPDNYLNLDGSDGRSNAYHIGERGALRLGKALWYLMARSSEPPSPPTPPVLSVSPAGGDSLQFEFAAGSNVLYSLQFTTDINNPSWHDLTNFPAQPLDWTARVTDTATNTAAFYRVLAQ